MTIACICKILVPLSIAVSSLALGALILGVTWTLVDWLRNLWNRKTKRNKK